MGLFNPGSGTGRSARGRAQRFDVLIGILGFFTFMAFVQALVLELRGEPAGSAAVVLAVLALALGLAIRTRRRIDA